MFQYHDRSNRLSESYLLRESIPSLSAPLIKNPANSVPKQTGQCNKTLSAAHKIRVDAVPRRKISVVPGLLRDKSN